MRNISTNRPSKSIIKNIKYKLNKKQYIDTGILTHCRAVNNGRKVRCRNPLWEESRRGNTAAASWAMTRHNPGVFSICECDNAIRTAGQTLR